jgi:serine/threonine protein kinase
MQDVLEKFGISQDNFLGEGVECKAFHLDTKKVIKIYDKYYKTEDFERMQKFYESLDTRQVNFITPRILSIQQDENYTYVIEKKLPGKCLPSTDLLNYSEKKLNIFIKNYIALMFSIRNIKTDFLLPAETLDTKGRFYLAKEYTDWKDLLLENLVLRYLQIRHLFNGSVFDGRYNFLVKYVQKLVYSNTGLIHGDISHNNLLIDDEMNITSVYDFSGFATKGDVVFDLTIGWTALQKLGSNKVSKQTLEQTFKKLSYNEQRNFVAYLMINCFITANMFVTNNVDEPHFKWCLDHLNNAAWWEMIGYKI